MKKSTKRIVIAVPVLLLAVLLTVLALAWRMTVPTPRFDGLASIESFGESGEGPGQFNEPTGIAIGADRVFVADARNGRIQVFSSAGKFQYAFGEAFLERPMNMAARNGHLYVADYFRDSIEVFRFDGTHLATIAIDEADGQNAALNSPGGVDVFADGDLLVADTYNHRVVRLAPAGEVVREWGTRGRAGRGRGRFRYPSDVEILADGGFLVADAYNHRIQRFDARGRPVNAWGGAFALGIPGSFNGWFNVVSSIDLAADTDSVLAVDFFNQRIQRFDLDGELLTVYPVAVAESKRSIIGIASKSAGVAWLTNLTRNRIERWRLDSGLR